MHRSSPFPPTDLSTGENINSLLDLTHKSDIHTKTNMSYSSRIRVQRMKTRMMLVRRGGGQNVTGPHLRYFHKVAKWWVWWGVGGITASCGQFTFTCVIWPDHLHNHEAARILQPSAVISGTGLRALIGTSTRAASTPLEYSLKGTQSSEGQSTLLFTQLRNMTFH